MALSINFRPQANKSILFRMLQWSWNIIVKYCKTMQNHICHICESLWKYLWNYMWNIIIIKFHIFVKTCENLREHICQSLQNLSISAKGFLRKLVKVNALAKSCDNNICLSANFLFFVTIHVCQPRLHYPGMPTNLWWSTKPVIQLLQVHRIMCNFPDLSCSQIFFCFN